MLRLTKKVDYGLIAIRHIALNHGNVISAREIAEKNRINYGILAKILQRLARAGIIVSIQGASGGYILAAPASKITVYQIIEAIEGPFGITECSAGEKGHDCCLSDCCTIRYPLKKIQHRIRHYLAGVTISKIT